VGSHPRVLEVGEHAHGHLAADLEAGVVPRALVVVVVLGVGPREQGIEPIHHHRLHVEVPEGRVPKGADLPGDRRRIQVHGLEGGGQEGHGLLDAGGSEAHVGGVEEEADPDRLRARRVGQPVLLQADDLSTGEFVRKTQDVIQLSPAETVDRLILVPHDTGRYFGCYGKDVPTPHIDRMAAEGVLFENFITSSPWTTPSHLSMLTSLHPVTHGLTSSFVELWKGLHVTNEFYRLPDERITLAEVLRDNGFATAAFTAGGPLDAKIGFGQGFDIYDSSMFKLRESNVGRMFDWIENNAGRRFFLFWHHFEVHAPYLHTDFLPELLPRERVEALSGFMGTLSAALAGEDPMGEAAGRTGSRSGPCGSAPRRD